MKTKLFNEVEDTMKNEKINIYLFGVPLGIVLLWVFTAIPEQSHNAAVYMFMLIVWGIGLTADLIWDYVKKPDQMSVNGMGKEPLKAFIIGIFVAFFLFLVVQFQAITPFSLINSTTLGFLFVVVAAPFVEANAFRGLIQPMLTNVFESWLIKNKVVAWCIALFIQCGAFSFFHVNVVGTGDITAYFPYFMFGLICTVLVYGTKSISAEWGLHGLNNLFAFLRI